MVAPSAHQIGRTKSAARPRTVKVSQKIFRSTSSVYAEFTQCRSSSPARQSGDGVAHKRGAAAHTPYFQPPSFDRPSAVGRSPGTAPDALVLSGNLPKAHWLLVRNRDSCAFEMHRLRLALRRDGNDLQIHFLPCSGDREAPLHHFRPPRFKFHQLGPVEPQCHLG
jgi:hypothetical protein